MFSEVGLLFCGYPVSGRVSVSCLPDVSDVVTKERGPEEQNVSNTDLNTEK